MTESTSTKNVVSPINFAREIGKVPQWVYAQMREGKLKSHECVCGHKYLLREEANAFMAARAAKKSA